MMYYKVSPCFIRTAFLSGEKDPLRIGTTVAGLPAGSEESALIWRSGGIAGPHARHICTNEDDQSLVCLNVWSCLEGISLLESKAAGSIAVLCSV